MVNTPSTLLFPSASGVKIIVISAFALLLAMAAVGLRIWARRIKGVAMTLNDHAIFAALGFEIAETITIIYGVVLGKAGYHASQLTIGEETSLSKAYLSAEPLWITANTCVKISILHLYLQLFPLRTFRYIVYGVMSLVLMYWVSTVVRMFFLCSPFAFFWDKSIVGGTCVDLLAAFFSVSIINLLMDVIVIALPIPIIWSLQIPRRKKVVISAIFGLGGVICVITVLRIVSVHRLDLSDIPYSVVGAAIWSDLEPCLGIINACLPVLQPALRRLFDCLHLGSQTPTTLANSERSQSSHQTQQSHMPQSPKLDSFYELPTLQDNLITPRSINTVTSADNTSESTGGRRLYGTRVPPNSLRAPPNSLRVPPNSLRISKGWEVKHSDG